MSDQIYLVDPVTQKLMQQQPLSFGELGIRERADLEQWIIKQPQLLGEDYLIISSEFDRFDKSSRRIDLIAIDRAGQLTVIELKLDASRSFADLQAIYYAAFLSSATIEDVIRMLSVFESCDAEDAEQRIREFVHSDDLPEFDGQPRIVLAAGSMDNEELTSSVLWLRRFGLDLTCVELTPYRLPEADQVVLVPRVIIPLPEARDYVVGVERKEAARTQHKKSDARIAELWNGLRKEFAKLDTPFVAGQAQKSMWCQVKPGHGTAEREAFDWTHIHYEWIIRKRPARLDVALHFEHSDRERNARLLELIMGQETSIRDGVDVEYDASLWGKKWAQVMFRLPHNLGEPIDSISKDGAELMLKLINRTWPILESANVN